MGKVTIEDISRHTGLSRGTVSRALNDRPDISEQTKQRVLEACNQLKYVPSHAARSLATGRRYAVAVVADSLSSAFAPAFLRGVLAQARTEHYAIHLTELPGEVADGMGHLRSLIGERIDALLAVTTLDPQQAQSLSDVLSNRPVVSTSPIPNMTCDVLGPDQHESGRLVARRMFTGGAHDVLYIHQTGNAAFDERREGFQEICNEHGIPADSIVIEIPPRTDENAADRLAGVRDRLGSVCAIAASDDALAVDIMLLCHEVGRVVGRDIAVLGQGNAYFSDRITPRLTTTDLGGEEIGQRAMELVLQRVKKLRQDAPQQTWVAPTLVQRESSRTLG